VLSKRVLKSGTSIGAMVREAEQAESKADFIHKMGVALKESNETDYWFILLRRTDYLTVAESDSILIDNIELMRLITSIIKSAKEFKK
jgi:four helix bundle protein